MSPPGRATAPGLVTEGGAKITDEAIAQQDTPVVTGSCPLACSPSCAYSCPIAAPDGVAAVVDRLVAA